MKFLVMMPTYNESEILESTVQNLFATLPNAQLLIIDDNSPDGTGSLADQLSVANPRISVLHRTEKNGLGAAYGAGVRWGLEAGFDYLVQMDADGSHRPADLVHLLERATDADLVIGSRWVAGGEVANWSKLRQAISRFGNHYARFWLGGAVRDMTAGFRVYSADLASRLPFGRSGARGYGFQVEMTMLAANSGAKILEVPIKFVEREGGASKMTLGIVAEAFWLIAIWGIRRLFRR